MSLPWFRVYGEMIDDGKLKSLAFEDRWHYVAVLCCKTQGVQDSTRPELLDRIMAAKLGLAAREADEVKRRLIDVDLITQDWQPSGWDRRQFKSDNSSARVAQWRKRKSESPPTPPSEEKEEQIQIQRGNVTSNVSVTLHESLPVAEWQEWLEHRKRRRWPCDPTTLKKQLKLLAAYDTAEQRRMLDTSIQAGWKGLFPPKGSGRPRPTRYEELMAQAQQPVDAPTDLTRFLTGTKI